MDSLKRVDAWFSTRNAAIFIGVCLLALAWWNRFLQDDAFISFRYAQHLTEGHGLVWNVGEPQPVEGYSNFLWVVLIAAGMLLGIEPEIWSMLLGFGAALCTLVVTYRLVRQMTESNGFALLAVFLLGTNYSFSAYVTGGLETQLQVLFVVLSYFLALQIHENAWYQRHDVLIALSLILAFAVMTRLDSVLLVGPAWLWVAWTVWKQGGARRSAVMALVMPGLLLGIAWFTFKWVYYGEILPNTAYVKITGYSLKTLKAGIWFVWSFLMNYSLLIGPLLWMFSLPRLLSDPLLRLLAGVCVLWSVYLIKIGGGFMEFRLMMPILPLILVLTVAALHSMRSRRLVAATASLMVLSSIAHAATFQVERNIESIDDLHAHVSEVGPDWGWHRIGQLLHESFGDAELPVVIATTAAGAIPYYSGLPTVDMLGLNDHWVARHGQRIDALAGHSRYATLDYLLTQGVNLVLGHPKVLPIASTRRYGAQQMFLTTYFDGPFDISDFPDEARVIEMPISDRYKVVMLYLRPHPEIDRVIREQRLAVYIPAR